MRGAAALILCLVVLGLPLHAAQAACRWAYVEGRPLQSCDNPLDTPATNLPKLSPSLPPGPPHIDMPTVGAARPGNCGPGAGQVGCR